MAPGPSPLRYDHNLIKIKLPDGQELIGKPTDLFIRLWNSQRNVNITVDGVEIELTDLLEREVVAGDYLTGGGPLGGPGDIELDHALSGVTPGTYGDATNVPQIEVDEWGHITDVTEIPIAGGGGSSWTLIEERVISSAVANEDFTGLGDYNEILVFGRLLTASESTGRLVRVSTDGGTSYFSTSGDYVSIVVAQGAELAASAIGYNGQNTTAARDVYCLIGPNIAGVPKYGVNRTQQIDRLFVANTDVINAIRVNTDSGDLTGGTIYVFGR